MGIESCELQNATRAGESNHPPIYSYPIISTDLLLYVVISYRSINDYYFSSRCHLLSTYLAPWFSRSDMNRLCWTLRAGVGHKNAKKARSKPPRASDFGIFECTSHWVNDVMIMAMSWTHKMTLVDFGHIQFGPRLIKGHGGHGWSVMTNAYIWVFSKEKKTNFVEIHWLQSWSLRGHGDRIFTHPRVVLMRMLRWVFF